MSNCVSDFFDAFFRRSSGGAEAEFIEMFAMRKLTVQRQGRETPESTSRFRRQVDRYEHSRSCRRLERGAEPGTRDIIAVAFSLYSCKREKR